MPAAIVISYQAAPGKLKFDLAINAIGIITYCDVISEDRFLFRTFKVSKCTE